MIHVQGVYASYVDLDDKCPICGDSASATVCVCNKSWFTISM